MTEPQLIELGFECKRRYQHDQFRTNRLTKGVLNVEFTYEGEELQTVDLTIGEVNGMPVTLEDMKAITPVLGDWKE